MVAASTYARITGLSAPYQVPPNDPRNRTAKATTATTATAAARWVDTTVPTMIRRAPTAVMMR
jgi:hypothetical protein